jgi:hypothetical protein
MWLAAPVLIAAGLVLLLIVCIFYEDRSWSSIRSLWCISAQPLTRGKAMIGPVRQADLLVDDPC